MTEREHVLRVELDHGRGGWIARCETCGWESKRPSWYKRRALGWAGRHIEETR